jgi:hypothetical protein
MARLRTARTRRRGTLVNASAGHGVPASTHIRTPGIHSAPIRPTLRTEPCRIDPPTRLPTRPAPALAARGGRPSPSWAFPSP